MDVFDEFEMKPLTEGLGFHNKTNNKSDNLDENTTLNMAAETASSPSTQVQKKSIDRATEALDKLMNSLNTLDKEGITFTDTLPSKENTVAKSSLENLAVTPEAPVQALKKPSPSIHPVVPTAPVLPKVEVPVVDTIKEEVKSTVATWVNGLLTAKWEQTLN